MHIKPIKNNANYRAALTEVEGLMTAMPDTPKGDRLDVMATLIEAYETKHFPMDLPDPVEAIKFEMERKGLTVKDLEPMIGRSNRVYEILNHKRSLTLKMIWRLHEGLGIPAELLLQPNLNKRKAATPKKSGSHHIVPNPNGGWIVKKDGAARSSRNFDKKQDAVDAGRTISRNQGTEFVIHGKDGKIQGKDSHGNDPYPPKG